MHICRSNDEQIVKQMVFALSLEFCLLFLKSQLGLAISQFPMTCPHVLSPERTNRGLSGFPGGFSRYACTEGGVARHINGRS